MIQNKFLQMLFDYRKPLSCREYWGSLLFLLMLLFSSVSVMNWMKLDEILKTVQTSGYSSFFTLGIKNARFLGMILDYFNSFLNFAVLAVAFSSIIITLKRSKTLGYSKIMRWIFAVITYLAFFSIISIYVFYVYYAQEFSHSSIIMPEEYEQLIPIGISILGIIIVLGIVSVILLSRKTESDLEELRYYYDYDSITAVF